MQKQYAFELFDTAEEAELRGTAIAVYEASEVDVLLDKIRTARREGWYEDNSGWGEIDKALGL